MTAISKSKAPRGFDFVNEMKFALFVIRVCHSQKLGIRRMLKVVAYAQNGWEEAKAISAELPRLCQDVFDIYLQHARADMMGSREAMDRSGNRTPVNHSLLRDIECNPRVGVSSAQAQRFRTEVMIAASVWHAHNDNCNIPYTVHEGLRRCLVDFVHQRLAA